MKSKSSGGESWQIRHWNWKILVATSCPHTIPVQKDLTLSCFLSSSIQPGSPAYLPSDWLLYSLGDWFTRSHLSTCNSFQIASPRREKLSWKRDPTISLHSKFVLCCTPFYINYKMSSWRENVCVLFCNFHCLSYKFSRQNKTKILQ